MRSSSVNIRNSGAHIGPLELEVTLGPGSTLAQIHAALARHGEPLRWAITSVPSPGHLGIEAVMLFPPPGD